APRNQDYKNKESTRRTVPMETSTSIALVSCDGLGGYDWSDQAEEGPNYSGLESVEEKLEIAQKEKDRIQFNVDKFENASKSLNKLIESQIVNNCKKGLGYNAVPPPYIGNFMPLTDDLSFTSLDEFVSDSEEENVSQTKTEKKTFKPSIAKIEFVKPKQHEKTAKKAVKQVEKHRQNTHSPRDNQRNWNNMMYQRLGSNFEMLRGYKEAQEEVGICKEVTQRKSTNVSITECHVGNPCELSLDPRAIIHSPMIR
ncbi:hypothetical protein Tco_0069346, partial [Tanacetum coccineum]